MCLLLYLPPFGSKGYPHFISSVLVVSLGPQSPSAPSFRCFRENQLTAVCLSSLCTQVQMTASKPAFFQVLIGDFCQRLRIPNAFVDEFMGTPPWKSVLKGPDGESWNVPLEERESGLFFCKGWQKFVKHHCLEEGDFLVFHYSGKREFDVTIFDESACEIDLEVTKRRSLAGGSSSQVVAEKAVIEETPSGVTVFKSNYSCFMQTLEKCRAYEFTVPKKIVKQEGLKGGESIRLEHGKKKPQKVGTGVTTDGRFKLRSGWRQSCIEFDISNGDNVVLEFVKPNAILVHNLRGKNVILDGPKAVDASNYRDI